MSGFAFPPDWPHRDFARQIRVGPHRWRVIDTGPKEAPALLLLHGLGASGHSFRALVPLLTEWRLVIPDLPGQGGSQTSDRRRITLDAIAVDLIALCKAIDAPVSAVVGHSAGAAIAIRIAQMKPEVPVIAINAALGHFDGAAGILFPLLAQGLASFPFAATAFAKLWGNPETVDKLLKGTGSQIDGEARAQYLYLVKQSAHVQGALDMMAQWKLDPLLKSLHAISSPVLFIGARSDLAVPPKVSEMSAQDMPNAKFVEVAGGHLVHEEDPERIAELIRGWVQEYEVAPRIMSR